MHISRKGAYASKMSSVSPAFIESFIKPARSPVRTSFISSQTIGRRLTLVIRKKNSECHVFRTPCCNLAAEDEGHINDEKEALYELDDEDLDLENFKFPEGVPILNTAYLTGRLGADPILKTVREGLDVCKFSIAVRHDYDPTDAHDNDTSWFDVEVWGSLGRSVASRVRKGIRVGISGSLDVNAWTTREGELIETPIVNATTVEVLQSRSEPMPASLPRVRPQGLEEGASPFVERSKHSGVQLEGDLSDLPF